MHNTSRQEETKSIVFKEGYVFEVKKIDVKTPEVQKIIEQTIQEQESILERKSIDLETLNRVYTV